MGGQQSSLPVVVELDPVPDVVSSLEAVADWPDVVLLESRIDREEVSRYSFLVADPVEFVDCVEPATGTDPFGRLKALLDPIVSGGSEDDAEGDAPHCIDELVLERWQLWAAVTPSLAFEGRDRTVFDDTVAVVWSSKN